MNHFKVPIVLHFHSINLRKGAGSLRVTWKLACRKTNISPRSSPLGDVKRPFSQVTWKYIFLFIEYCVSVFLQSLVYRPHLERQESPWDEDGRNWSRFLSPSSLLSACRIDHRNYYSAPVNLFCLKFNPRFSIINAFRFLRKLTRM